MLRYSYLSTKHSKNFIISFSITWLFLSCASPPGKKLVKNGITLQYLTKNSKAAELKNIRLDHPVKITQKQIRNHLLSLYYEQLSFIGKKGRIYSINDANRISQLLAKAFQQASPENIISYEIKTANGKTEGETFFSHNQINWRFKKIHGLDFFNNTSNTRGTLVRLWKLVPQKGQRIFVTNHFLGNKKRDNWIVSNLNLYPLKNKNLKKKKQATQRNSESKKRLAKPTHDPKNNSSVQKIEQGNPELEEKLRFLKNLLEKDLIDETDIERKRKELLDRFF